jgi:3-mercaptopyruvate sulfurtransferase SseA
VGEQLIKKFEYTNIKILEGGWSKWLEAGYPVDKK